MLTVSVSIAAGVAALTSAVPTWHLNRVEVSLAFVAILMISNLRGVRESGRLFAAPTYFFIASILAMIGVGAWRYMSGSIEPGRVSSPISVGEYGGSREYRLDDSGGPGGGFFDGDPARSDFAGLKRRQQLLVVGLILTSGSR